MLLFELEAPAFTQVSAKVDMFSKNPDVPTREVGNASPVEAHAEDKDEPEYQESIKEIRKQFAPAPAA